MGARTQWNPSEYAKSARFVAELGEPLLDLLRAEAGETILDLGCGDGALTEKLAAGGCAVYGVDASFAQAKAARIRGLHVAVMDARELAFRQQFDGVLSNAVLHWIKSPDRVAAGVWNCLKLRGRFVGEFGGRGNIERVRRALHQGLALRGIDPAPVDPWYYPSPGEYSVVLEHAGFTVERTELFARPTRLPGDITEWLGVFAQPFITALPEADRARYIDGVRASLAPELHDRSGFWTLDYVRLRFAARK